MKNVSISDDLVDMGKLFTVQCNYGLSYPELVKMLPFGHVDEDLNEEFFPVHNPQFKSGIRTVDIRLFLLTIPVYEQRIIELIEKGKMRPANIHETVHLAVQYPIVQEIVGDSVLISLGTIFMDQNRNYSEPAIRFKPKLGLYISSPHAIPGDGAIFPAVMV